VGISSRNIAISTQALQEAFRYSEAGDTVIAVHYPANPFAEEGLSSVFEAHYSSMAEANLDVLMCDSEQRIRDVVDRCAATNCKPGTNYEVFIGMETMEPHRSFVLDAARGVPEQGIPAAESVYVGHSRRKDRSRLVEPNKLYDVAEYIVQNTPCNVVIVKNQQ